MALLIPTLDQLGGAERQVMLLAQGLAQRGWRVSVISLSGDGGDRATELSAVGVAFLSLKMRKGWADLRGWKTLRNWIRAEKPDVLHAHLPHAVWMARWVRLFVPVRVVVDTIHTSATGPLSRQRGYRWSNWLSDQSTAVSSDVSRAYCEAGILDEARVTVVPNAIDTAQWIADSQMRAKTRRDHGIEDKFLWLAVGRLESVKDYATLLYAFSSLPYEPWLAIAGDGSLRAGLERLSEQLGIYTRVTFLGFVKNPVQWMQTADAYVLTSLWEGLPMSVLEAGACALPVVATDVAGTRELISVGHTGLLAEAGDVKAVEAAMKRVMDMTPGEHASMGAYARKQVSELYAMEPVLDKWEQLYESLLERNPEPRRKANATIALLLGTGETAQTAQ
ncbi:MAG: glycosyltransferase [Acidobacteriota bacterium]|nr:glycosyltransferase [Acidobacteriota bacterium]